jgi:hypothetical protein
MNKKMKTNTHLHYHAMHTADFGRSSSGVANSTSARLSLMTATDTATYTSIKKKSVQVVSTILARLSYCKPIF